MSSVTASNINSRVNIGNVNEADDTNALVEKLKGITTRYFFRPDRAVIQELKNIDAEDLTQLLKSLFTEMIEEELVQNPEKIMDRLAQIIPLETLQDAIEGDVEDALEEAKEMFEEARIYLEATQTASPTLKSRLKSILSAIINVIESIITAFGLGDFFKPSESEFQGSMKAQKFFMLITLFGTLTGWVLPLLGAATGGAVIAGVLLVIIALSIIWPYIKPVTTHLPCEAENFTHDVLKGNFVDQGRKESLDKIANILKMNRHAILVGESRVGKSLTAKAFAHAVERGDYPELAGKVVFRINTSNIVGDQASFFGGNKIVEKISSEMGRHRDDIILVLDEIHMACKGDSQLADKLKTYLDAGGDFPHVIGITTNEEYNKHVKNNHAFSMRFDKVKIKNTDKDETLQILSDKVLRSKLKPIIEDGALELIYEKATVDKSLPQPATSMKLLNRCINQTGRTQKSPTEKEIARLSNQILSHRTKAAAMRGRKRDKNNSIAALETELAELKETLQEERKELNHLFKSKDLFDRVTQATYSAVAKIPKVANAALSSKNEKQLKIFILLHEFLGRTLEAHIREKSEELDIETVIDQDLVEQVACSK